MLNRFKGINLARGSHRRDRRIPEEAMIAKHIMNGPPNAMYDMGVGVYSEFRTLKKIYPNIKLFGCEPCLVEYTELLPIFDGQLLNIAVGNNSGKHPLYTTPLGIGGSTLLPTMGNASRLIEMVDVWTLDQFDEWAGKPDRILLWMDIEGSELEALISGPELMASGRVEWINLETRDARVEGHPTTDEITSHLDKLGYRFIVRYNVQGTYPEAPGDTIYFKVVASDRT